MDNISQWHFTWRHRFEPNREPYDWERNWSRGQHPQPLDPLYRITNPLVGAGKPSDIPGQSKGATIRALNFSANDNWYGPMNTNYVLLKKDPPPPPSPPKEKEDMDKYNYSDPFRKVFHPNFASSLVDGGVTIAALAAPNRMANLKVENFAADAPGEGDAPILNEGMKVDKRGYSIIKPEELGFGFKEEFKRPKQPHHKSSLAPADAEDEGYSWGGVTTGMVAGNLPLATDPWVSLYDETLGAMKLRIDEHALPDPPEAEPDPFCVKVYKNLQESKENMRKKMEMAAWKGPGGVMGLAPPPPAGRGAAPAGGAPGGGPDRRPGSPDGRPPRNHDRRGLVRAARPT